MSARETNHVYVGIVPACGCMIAVNAADSCTPDENADFVSGLVRGGLIVRHMTHAEYARADGLFSTCPKGADHFGETERNEPATTRPDGLRLYRVVHALGWLVAAKNRTEADGIGQSILEGLEIDGQMADTACEPFIEIVDAQRLAEILRHEEDRDPKEEAALTGRWPDRDGPMLQEIVDAYVAAPKSAETAK